MRKVILGKTGVAVSAISLGTWAFGGENKSGKKSVGWADQQDDDSRSALLTAYEKGINHWDTADVYGEGRGFGICFLARAQMYSTLMHPGTTARL